MIIDKLMHFSTITDKICTDCLLKLNCQNMCVFALQIAENALFLYVVDAQLVMIMKQIIFGGIDLM